jgi:hypothetical protein
MNEEMQASLTMASLKIAQPFMAGLTVGMKSIVPQGTTGNSPPFQRRVRVHHPIQVPAGTAGKCGGRPHGGRPQGPFVPAGTWKFADNETQR